MSQHAAEIAAGKVLIRHVTKVAAGTAGATVILGNSFIGSFAGLNGPGGFVTGNYERRMNEEGSFTLTFPNGAGGDGILHRDRFLICGAPANNYRPGDEWFEIWKATDDLRPSDLLFVGTPTKVAPLARGQMQITGWDAFWTLKRVRDTAASFWCHDPRSVFEHYSRAWIADIADPFDGVALTAGWTAAQTGATTGVVDGQSALTLTAAGSGSKYAITQPISTNRDRWQIAATILACAGGTAQGVFIGGVDVAAGTNFIGMNVGPDTVTGKGVMVRPSVAGISPAIVPLGPFPLPAELKVEVDARWAYFYVSGQLINVLPRNGVTAAFCYVGSLGSTGASGNITRVDNVIARTCQPYLMRNANIGDLRLPGAPPVGGLIGEYFDEHDTHALDTSAWPAYSLNGTRKAMSKRLDAHMDFAPANFNTFAPNDAQTANGEYNALRWTGSIYLDFDIAADYAFRLRGIATQAQIAIGDTRLTGPPVGTGTVTTSWLKAGSSAASAPSGATGVLAGGKTGWYPIVIEYLHSTGAPALHVEYSRSDGVGSWGSLRDITDPADNFGTPLASRVRSSPLGIFQGNPRLDSHYNQLLELANTFGLQFTCTPMSLESGEFPGSLRPLVRLGRDTEYILNSIEGTDIQTNIDSEDTVDALLLDGAGTGADDSSSSTIEAINYNEITGHMFISSDQDSVGDISIPALLAQRADSLVALRESPWEEVGATPKGQAQVLDSFPLSGALAKFEWGPGDGIRLKLRELGVDDTSPRQILGVSWPISPNGIGRPDAKFRQRPRSLREVLRQQFRAAALERRNYQNSRATYAGSVGSVTTSAGADNFSRIAMPTPFSDLIKLELIVGYKSAGSAMSIVMNGVTAQTITTTGVYDVTSYAIPQAAPGGPTTNAQLTGAADGYEIQLLATIRN